MNDIDLPHHYPEVDNQVIPAGGAHIIISAMRTTQTANHTGDNHHSTDEIEGV
jgi:hypothetical protein